MAAHVKAHSSVLVIGVTGAALDPGILNPPDELAVTPEKRVIDLVQPARLPRCVRL